MAAAGVPATTPLATVDGDVVATIDGVLVEVEPYVSSDEKTSWPAAPASTTSR